LALTCGLFSSGLLLTLNQTNCLWVKLLLGTVLTCAQVPGGSWYVPAWAEVHHPECPQFLIAQTGETPTGLLRYQGENWLINTGNARDFHSVVNPLRKYFGVNSWQGVILTQLTGPAAGGADSLVQAMRVDRWLLPPASTRGAFLKPWLASLENQKRPKEFLWQGHEWRWDDDFSVEVLAPSGTEPGARAEDRAAVLLFRYRQITLLWAGALNATRERDLLERYPQLRAQILVQSLPATEDGFSLPWLQQVRPEHVIQSARSPFRPGPYSRDPVLGLPVTQRPTWWRQEDVGAVRIDYTQEGPVLGGFLNQVDRVSP
jgi:beta-lactamase superfamily II metal-dependent hydrolase